MARLLLLSAAGASELEAAAAQLGNQLVAPDTDLDQLADRLAASNHRGPWRLAWVASDAGEASVGLQQALGRRLRTRPRFHPPKVALAFTGQGGQWRGMGLEPWRELPAFRRVMAHLDQQASSYPLRRVVAAADARIHRVEHAQAATIALQLGLAGQLRECGLDPAAVIGHSVGELAAAAEAGVFTAAQALEMAVARGRLMAQLPERGAMAALMTDAATVEAARSDGAEIAALNGPHNTVIAGDSAAVDDTLRRLDLTGVEHRRLRIAQASHCHLLEPMLDAWEASARALTASRPVLTMISTLTGKPVTEAPDARHWRRHARQPVRWAEGVRALVDAAIEVVVEVGPRPQLTALGELVAPHVVWLTCPPQGRRGFLEVLAALFELGCAVTEPLAAPAPLEVGHDLTLARVGEGVDEAVWLQADQQINGSDPAWAPEEREAVRQVFDPAVNSALDEGEAARWVALDPRSGTALGRIAAFGRRGHDTGGFGFFACVDDDGVARRLLDTAAEWHRERGRRLVEGPTNFGERDRFAGLLVRGFFPPLSLEPFNPPYCVGLLRRAGLVPLFDSLTYRLDLSALGDARLLAASTAGPEKVRCELLGPSDGQRFGADVLRVYHPSFNASARLKSLDSTQLARLAAANAPSTASTRVMMAYLEDQPAGFIAFLSDPLLGLTKCYGLAVRPDARLAGVDASLVLALRDHLQAQGHDETWLAGIAGYSKRVIRFVEDVLGAELERVHVTWAMPLDGQAPEPRGFHAFRPEAS